MIVLIDHFNANPTYLCPFDFLNLKWLTLNPIYLEDARLRELGIEEFRVKFLLQRVARFDYTHLRPLKPRSSTIKSVRIDLLNIECLLLEEKRFGYNYK
jgi:hypothetical protein